jgi:hypothetical protein
MAESKQKKKLLLKKKLADDIESSKLISEFNNRNARNTMKKITNITKTKLIHQPSNSNNNTQSSFQKKDIAPKILFPSKLKSLCLPRLLDPN